MTDDEDHSAQGPEGQPIPEQQMAMDAVREAFEGARAHLPTRAGLGALLLGGLLGRIRRFPRLLGRRLRVFAFGLLIVVLSVTTCSFGVDPATLTESYGDPVPASAEAAVRFAEKGATALEGISSNNSLRLTVSQSEATSALSLGMMLPQLMMTLGRIPPEDIRSATDLDALRVRVWEEEEAARDSLLAAMPISQRLLAKLDPRIRTGDVQVRFEGNGEVVVAGFVQAWSFRQPAMFVVAPRASSGALELRFVKGRLGRLPAPAFVFDALGQLIARAVLLGRDYAEVSELSVTDGSLTFAGRIHTPSSTR